MLPPLAAYDATAIAAAFDDRAGRSALRSRTVSVLATVGSLVATVGPSLLLAACGVGDRLVPNAAAIREALVDLGPTAIKFGQAAANRPDLFGADLADELRLLQDSVRPFATEDARATILADLPPERAAELLHALPIDAEPVAAASLGQVYRLDALGETGVAAAVKVLRPDARELVAIDALLLRCVAGKLESLRGPGGERLIKPALVNGVDEFFTRLWEEMDYERELANLIAFTQRYGRASPAAAKLRRTSGGGELVLPTPLPAWSGTRVLAMSWVEGTPLLSKGAAVMSRSNLPLVCFGIEATLVQLLEEGLLHADPHSGNLLSPPPRRRRRDAPRLWWAARRGAYAQAAPPRLAYLDFGMVAEVPRQVRDALVCAVVSLLFDGGDMEAVASLFSDLMLLPEAELAAEAPALTAALRGVAAEVLVRDEGGGDALPKLRFDQLLSELALVAPRFRFELPPYFLNNARALATLEGMARSADPDFDVLQVLYPYALRRLLGDSSSSPQLRSTLLRLTRGADGEVEPRKVLHMLEEAARLSGRSRRRVLLDSARTPGGRALARDVAASGLRRGLARLRGGALLQTPSRHGPPLAAVHPTRARRVAFDAPRAAVVPGAGGGGGEGEPPLLGRGLDEHEAREWSGLLRADEAEEAVAGEDEEELVGAAWRATIPSPSRPTLPRRAGRARVPSQEALEVCSNVLVGAATLRHRLPHMAGVARRGARRRRRSAVPLGLAPPAELAAARPAAGRAGAACRDAAGRAAARCDEESAAQDAEHPAARARGHQPAAREHRGGDGRAGCARRPGGHLALRLRGLRARRTGATPTARRGSLLGALRGTPHFDLAATNHMYMHMHMHMLYMLWSHVESCARSHVESCSCACACTPE